MERLRNGKRLTLRYFNFINMSLDRESVSDFVSLFILFISQEVRKYGIFQLYSAKTKHLLFFFKIWQRGFDRESFVPHVYFLSFFS